VTKPKDTKAKEGDATSSQPKLEAASTMTQIDSELIRQLAGVLNETGLTEIEYDTGGIRIRVARGMTNAMVATGPAVYATQDGAGAPAAAAKPADLANHPGAVKSPMVGVAYLLPEPGAAPFIKVGDQVTEGQTIALIEAMKTFNPVKAHRAGKIVRIIFDNGSPVEYGELLAVIE